jgi:predicted transcriptional regulator
MTDLNEIKRLRKKLNLTQHDLAIKANVSQSLIAKIESGKIDPSYTNAKKIFDTLNSLDTNDELNAKDIMYKKIIYADANESVKETIIKMRNKNISQLPVMNHNKIVGFISESLLLDKVLEGHTQEKVSDVMENNPPIMPPLTKQSVIANLLKHFPLVLIEDKGKFIGIVTKADLLKAVYD